MQPETYKFLSESQRRSFAEGEAKGKAEGKAEGEAKGKAEGKAEGKAKGKADSVLRVLMRRAIPVSQAKRERILECHDLETLDLWFDRAFVVVTAEELLA